MRYSVSGLAMAALLTISANAMADDDVNFSIEEQDVASALRSLADQADVSIMFSPDEVGKQRVRGLTGTYDLDEALRLLLEGTGLQFERTPDNLISVKKRRQKTGQADGSITRLAAAQGTGRASVKLPDGQLKGSVGGQVKDLNSGMGLAGALVRIQETGQTTSTDDNGNFRFSRVQPGNYTLFISYLGYSTVIADFAVGKGEDIKVEYALGRTAGDIEEIVVFGSRSARARALNQERMADNMSSVISADTLGNFTGTTIAEALRRVPGVSFQRDDLTGDGTNIMIRGMAPDMNAVKFNGLHLPVGNGENRSASLGNLLADSIEKITIHKSLLPSHDSAGTGGLIEIETKSPLSRDRRYANFSVERGWRAGNFSDDLLVSGTVSGTFGSDDNFGLSASVQYRDRDVRTTSYYAGLVSGKYLPLEQDGSLSITTPFHIDPRTPFPFNADAADAYATQLGYASNIGETSTLAVTLSAEWHIQDHTDLTLDVVRSQRDVTRYSSNVGINATTYYMPQPVASLDGEIRRALTWSGAFDVNQSYFYSPDEKDVTNTYSLRGKTTFDQWDFDYTLGYAHGASSTPNRSFVVFRGPAAFGSDLVLDEAIDPVEGWILSPFGIRTGNLAPLPLLTDAGWALLNDPGAYQIVNGRGTANSGKNDRYTADFKARHNFDSEHLKYLEAGINFESSRLESTVVRSSGFLGKFSFISDPCCSFGWPSAADLGLSFDGLAGLSDIGFVQDFSVITRSDIMQFMKDVPSLIAADDPLLIGMDIDVDPLLADTFTKERNFAAYLQTHLQFGKLEIIGGARLSRVKVRAVNITSPQVYDEFGQPDLVFEAEFKRLSDTSGLVTNILPRVLFNYRESDNLVLRAGYFMSTARPAVSQISRDQRITLRLAPFSGPNNNQPSLNVYEGNPNLKPAITHNFDFSFEYYHDQIGVIKIGAFYKHINNLLQTNTLAGLDSFDNIDFPDHPYFTDLPENLFVTVFRPENSKYMAKIWGFEAHIERQFTFLPGVLAGFGMFANYTYSRSSKHHTYAWFGSPVLDESGNVIPMLDFFGNPNGIERELKNIEFSSIPFDQQAKHSGTAALTYNLHNIDATLAYTFQSRLQQGFSPYNLIRHTEAVKTLDFRAEYRFNVGGGMYRLYFSGEDMLKGTSDPDLLTSEGGIGNTPKFFVSGTYLGGRVMKVGLAASF